MKNWALGLLTTVMTVGFANKGNAQAGIIKFDKAVPMTNFGWTADAGATDSLGRVDLMNQAVTNRAMVVEREEKVGKKWKTVNDTLVFQPIAAGDTSKPDGYLYFGTNQHGDVDVQAAFYEQKALCFLNMPYQMPQAATMPFRLVKYEADKMGKIKTWIFPE